MLKVLRQLAFTAMACLVLAAAGPGGAFAQSQKKCSNCGRVAQIKAVESSDWKKWAAPAAAGAAGGLIGHQFGGGSGKTALTIAGALGGAMLGHKVESNNRDKTYEVVVKMDDGSYRTFNYKSTPPVREGERVRVRDGQLVIVES